MKFRKQILVFFLFIGFFNGYNQDIKLPFYADIIRFNEIDRLNPPPQNSILFVGSSSFTLWQDVAEYFPEFSIINRGFGGSTLADQIRYVNEIVFPYAPKQIVIYCGENDFAASDTVTSGLVTHRFVTLFNLIRAKLPDVTITYVTMKPSPSRWHLADKFVEANKNIQDFMEQKPNTSFINIWDAMLDNNSVPDKSLFLDDMLHINSKGYDIWQKAIEPHLIQ